MKHIIGIGLAALVVVCAGCQARPSAGNDQTRNSITVNGCVQVADPAANPASADNFVLTNPGGATYKLDGKTSELRQHVNHQVEITGHVDTSAPPRDSAATGANPELAVDAVRMIAAACQP
jgi:hypothetical protein